MTTVYRIISAPEWQAARAAGTFRGSEHDLRDGFIHFSARDQVAGTAAMFYRGLPDLLLLYVRAEALGPALKWEPASDGRRFPHLYAELPAAAVHRVEALPLDPDGSHRLPSLEA